MRRRWRIALLTLVALVATLAVVTATATRLQTSSSLSVEGDSAWTAPCRSHEPRHDRVLLARCARATGVVAHVRREGHSTSQEVHFALLGRFGALIVKIGDPPAFEAPHFGSRVTVVGPLVRAQNGMREIEAWSAH